jgi:diaminohydroxyphosphoribosylaminopyrimidine deaminase/5-amino-6-(5-phosphoribosylamino)uracil reductase
MKKILDSYYLSLALEQAKQYRGFCAPNPAVGAIIVSEAGELLATGSHKGPGLPHAEIDALSKLEYSTLNATIYVTLEPCCHYGRTPPCTEALIQSGIKRVVYAYRDPNPIVAGNGELALQAAGLLCEHISLSEINDFYKSYHSWHITNKPTITAKIALTLDGKIADENSQPIKITGDQMNAYTHHQRRVHDAILTTAKTIEADNPQLNVRSQNEVFRKPLYVLDTLLTIPLNSKVFTSTKSITLFHSELAPKANKEKLIALGARCIEVKLHLEKLDLTEIVAQIGKDGIHDLWIEAGGKCFSAFVSQQLVHRALIYIAPHSIGDGLSAFQSDFVAMLLKQEKHWEQIGQDVLCVMDFSSEVSC